MYCITIRVQYPQRQAEQNCSFKKRKNVRAEVPRIRLLQAQKRVYKTNWHMKCNVYRRHKYGCQNSCNLSVKMKRFCYMLHVTVLYMIHENGVQYIVNFKYTNHTRKFLIVQVHVDSSLNISLLLICQCTVHFSTLQSVFWPITHISNSGEPIHCPDNLIS